MRSRSRSPRALVGAALQSGTIIVKQSSGGKKTIIEGLAVGLY